MAALERRRMWSVIGDVIVESGHAISGSVEASVGQLLGSAPYSAIWGTPLFHAWRTNEGSTRAAPGRLQVSSAGIRCGSVS